MTRDEAKELLPIIKAFSEGEIIESKQYDHDKWLPVNDLKLNSNFYRIKPEPKYRAFRDAKEFEPLSNSTICCNNEMFKVQYFTDTHIKVWKLKPVTWQEALNKFYWFDSTPFGKEVE